MPSCLIGLGSNLGDRAALLRAAVAGLRATREVDVRAVSSWHATLPVGGPVGQGEFLNGAARLDCSLPPTLLLAALQQIEHQLGRGPGSRWEARPIDLDLLLYGDLVLEGESLTVPHPWMAIRRFVLDPAVEVAADMIHPIIGWTVKDLRAHILYAPPYLAVTGIPGAGKTSLVESVLREVSGRAITLPRPESLATAQFDDSTGHVWDTEIEFLRERTRLLDRSELSSSEELTFSDFWLRQSGAYGRLSIPEARWEALDQRVEQACEGVIEPKLMFLLNVSPEAAPPFASASCGFSVTQLQRLQSELTRIAKRPGQGPVLHVDAHDRLRAAAEVTAAIQAMNA